MANSQAERRRTACEGCGLPFYAEKGECPYCAWADPAEPASEESGFVFGTHSVDDRRTECPKCGLPHYEDADRCPYCEYAEATGDGESSEETPRERPTDDAAATESSPGLFGRLKAALGL